MRERIENKLMAALAPQRMRLVDETSNHSVPVGSESHWNLIIVAPAFEGQLPLQRHRAVYAALSEEMRDGIHALTMKTLTPEEWEAAGGEVTHPAPPCRGGSAAG